MIFPWYVLVYNLPRKLNLSTLSILSPFRVGLSVTYICHIFYYIAPVFYRDLSAQAAMDTRVTRLYHYNDVIMSAMASQITRLTIVSSTVDTDADHRKLQSSVSLAFVRGIHRWPVSSQHKRPATRNMLPFYDVIMQTFWYYLEASSSNLKQSVVMSRHACCSSNGVDKFKQLIDSWA